MLQKRIEALILDNQMQEIYSGAILGFSGGADSSTLLHLLKGRVKNLLCVHINHMIRGEEAKRDEDFAKEICQKYGVNFMSYKVDVPALSKERKKGLEEVAREERYKIFQSLLDSHPEYKCIVTAHNLDDSLETVIFNFARGTGPKGLLGISPKQGVIFRPLITTSKKEILEYCEKNEIPYVTDSTNEDTQYTRNHIRHNVIPSLEKINPDILGASSRLGDILRCDEEYFAEVVDKIIENEKIVDKIPLSLLITQKRSISSRLLSRVLNNSIDYASTVKCIDLAKNGIVGSMLNLPNGVTFKIERGYAHFIKTNELDSIDYKIKLENGVNKIDQIDTVITVNDNYVPNGYTLSYKVSLNLEKITGTLYARPKKDGDTIKSGKMTKKLKKLFVDSHTPSHLRTKIPIILMENEIISVPGIKTRDDFSGNDLKINIYTKR